MARRIEDHIPPNILMAAQKAGLKSPDWYVGRSHDPNHQRKMTLEDIADEVGRKIIASEQATDTSDQISQDE
jgi:hypothetical protein